MAQNETHDRTVLGDMLNKIPTSLLEKELQKRRPVSNAKTSVPLIVIDDISDVEDDDSDVEFVANSKVLGDVHANDDDNGKDGNKRDEDIEYMGTSNAVDLPHARHECPHHAFVPDVLHDFSNTAGFRVALASTACKDLATNAKTCAKCFCFVCDCMASECKSWSINVCNDLCSGNEIVDVAKSLSAASCHCLASRNGADGKLWFGMREDKRKEGGGSSDAARPRETDESGSLPSSDAAASSMPNIQSRTVENRWDGRRPKSKEPKRVARTCEEAIEMFEKILKSRGQTLE